MRLALIIPTPLETTMIGIVLALLSALTYGSSVVLIRKKLNESDFMSVVLVITVTGMHACMTRRSSWTPSSKLVGWLKF